MHTEHRLGVCVCVCVCVEGGEDEAAVEGREVPAEVTLQTFVL